tara:strand:+ start:1845 stop:2237 length:393 start_codon:yes stop_codon:yes gene_type:complete
MANTFLRKTSKSVGIAASDSTWWQVGASTAGASQSGAYTVTGSGKTTTVIGFSITNVTGSSVDVDVAISTTMANITNDISLASSVPIPSGSVLILVGGDQKLNMIENDLIKIKSSANNSVDVCMSVLEIT